MKTIAVPGRCRCGRVRFMLREEPISFYLCHCTLCPAESGSNRGGTNAIFNFLCWFCRGIFQLILFILLSFRVLQNEIRRTGIQEPEVRSPNHSYYSEH